MVAGGLVERQDLNYFGYDDYYGAPSQSWWWSPAGYAVRYTIVIVLFLIIFGYFGCGYIHARQRLKKGKQPLAYHRWMVRRQMYYQAGYGNTQYQNNEAWVGATPYHAAPPPAYNASQPPPPGYEPAPDQEGKIAADQHFHAPVHRVGGSSTNAQLPAVAQRG